VAEYGSLRGLLLCIVRRLQGRGRGRLVWTDADENAPASFLICYKAAPPRLAPPPSAQPSPCSEWNESAAQSSGAPEFGVIQRLTHAWG